jgi:hypothetical protein
MSVLIRVEDEPPRSRLDYFRHVVADTFVPFDLQIDADHDFRARILTGQVGTVHVAKVRAPRLKAFRTPKLIRVSDPELFKLEVPVRGHTVFAQGDREAVLARVTSPCWTCPGPASWPTAARSMGMWR